MGYVDTLLIFCAFNIIQAVSLNFIIGYTGMLNLGHAAFIGIGAYTSALLMLAGWPWWFAVLAAATLGALAGFLIGLPCMRLRGDYLAIATLGFGEIIRSVMKNWISLTNGPLGIKAIPKPSLFGITFSTSPLYLLLTAAIALLCVLLIVRLVRSPFGRVLQAIREDDIAASAIGKHVARYKLQTLMIGAALAAVSGSLYAHYITFIDPGSFDFIASVYIAVMAVIGGLGTITGSITGAVLITLLPEPLRFLGLPANVVGAFQQMIFALILIAIMLWRPQGIFGKERAT